jgi:hypothetical protein
MKGRHLPSGLSSYTTATLGSKFFWIHICKMTLNSTLVIELGISALKKPISKQETGFWIYLKPWYDGMGRRRWMDRLCPPTQLIQLIILRPCKGKMTITGKSFSKALIFASTHNMMTDCSLNYNFNTCCVQKLCLTFRTIFVHNMFSPCSAKRRASDKDLPVQIPANGC